MTEVALFPGGESALIFYSSTDFHLKTTLLLYECVQVISNLGIQEWETLSFECDVTFTPNENHFPSNPDLGINLTYNGFFSLSK